MTKKTFTGKGGETWEWEETPEATEAIKRLHDDIRRLKAEDDKMNYDTSGKWLIKLLQLNLILLLPLRQDKSFLMHRKDTVAYKHLTLQTPPTL